MSNFAVILAGGKGTRLKPFTITIPKPLVPIGENPILELIIKKLEKEGFREIIITVNHLAELIKAFFGDGTKWGVDIKYSLEDMPLSTMGPLRLIDCLPDNFLVLNGDVLTDLDFSELMNHHIANNNLFTIATHMRKEKIDYGVLDLDSNGRLIDFKEKPYVTLNVSMGVYAVNKRILDFIPENKFYGFDDLMLDLLKNKEVINTYSYKGHWLDIGRPDDYERALKEFEKQYKNSL